VDDNLKSVTVEYGQ